MDKMDCKILAEVFRVLLETGAASTERLLKETKLDHARTIQWACYQLDCSETGGLWTLPDRMLPRDWNREPIAEDVLSAIAYCNETERG